MVTGLQYPGNQDYDPITLRPSGKKTQKRVELMERNMPQLMAGGESLLDIGSNKGFVCFWLRDKFREIDGYEQSHACQIAEAVRCHHGLEHIRFVNKPFRRIPLHKGLVHGCKTYDVVYCGSVQHHLFKSAMLHEAPFHLPLKKLVALAERLLILDGPVEFDRDNSLNTWAKRYGWGDEVRRQYTLEAHVEALKPQFELVGGPHDNERGRQTLVFERVAPNMPTRDVTESDLVALRQQGKIIKANNARADDSVIKVGGQRYKFDKGLQSDAVFMVLNSLPEWFLHTREVLVQNGKRIGDLTDWVKGVPNSTTKKIARHWLQMNNMLACIGLVEIHLKLKDYVLREDGRYIDVDVDMLSHVDRIAPAADYLTKWIRGGAKDAFGDKLAHYIVKHLKDEWVFREALARLNRNSQ